MTDPQKKLLTPDEPYPGLSSFEEAHEAYFFGRDREIAELLELIRACPLGVLYAKAGFGKTSLLQAGVFRHLRVTGFVPVRVRFDFGADPEGRPSPPLARQVLEKIAGAIRDGALDAPLPREDESLWDYCYSSTFWSPEGSPATPVIVLDQFEEVFTLGAPRRAELESLAEELRYLVEGRIPAQSRARVGAGEIELARIQRDAPPVRVLISLREDFLGDLVALRPRLGSLDLAAGAMHLGPLSYDAAIDAVWRPAQPRKLVDREVAELIVQRAAGLEASPPAPRRAAAEVEAAILALFCDKLNERRIRKGRKAIDADLVRGSAATILQEFYDERTAQVSATLRPILEDELLTPDGRRDMRAQAILVQRGADPAELGQLVDRRLLRKEERLGQPYYEIIHDVLTGVIEQSRAKRRAAEAQARAQAKADEDERRRQEEEKAELRRRAEEAQRKAAEERAKLAEELAAAKKREAEVAEAKQREAEEKAKLAEEKAKLAEELASAKSREAALAQEKADREKREETERARKQTATRRTRLGVAAVVVVTVAAGVGAYLHQDGAAKQEEAERKLIADTTRALSEERKLAVDLADQAARAMNGDRWTDAARLLLRANQSVDKAEERERKLLEKKAAVPADGAGEVRALVSLLSDRALAFTAGGTALMEDRAGLQGIRVSAGGTRGAVLSRDLRTVHTIELLPGARPTKMAAPGEELEGKEPPALQEAAEKVDWFSGNLREIVLSGDGKRLFGLGEKGGVVVWDAASGLRLLGFRTQLADAQIQVDLSGEHALLQDPVEPIAILVKIDFTGATIGGTRLFQQGSLSPAPPETAPSPSLREAQLRPTGGDVVASWLVPGAGTLPDKGRIEQWSSEGKKLRTLDLPAPAQSLLVSSHPGSPGSMFLAAAAEGEDIHLWSPKEGTFVEAGTLGARTQWLAGTAGTVIAADERGVKGWAVKEAAAAGQGLSAEPLFDVYLGEAPIEVALFGQGERLAVMTDSSEIRLYDRSTNKPLSALVPPVPEAFSTHGGLPFSELGDMPVDSVRLLPDARGVVGVAAFEGVVRFAPLGATDPADRFVWGTRPPRKASVVFPLPQDRRPLLFRHQGSRVLVSDRVDVWISRKIDPPKEPVGAELFSKWKRLTIDVVDVALWDGPGETHVVALGRDGKVHFGDAEGVKARQPAVTAKGSFLSRWLLQLSPDGKWAATGGVGQRIHVWELASRKPIWAADIRKQANTLSAQPSTVEVTALAVLPDARAPVVVAGDRRGGLRAFRTGGKNKDVWSSATFEGAPHKVPVTVLGAGASGTGLPAGGTEYRVASGAADGTTAVWTVGGGPWTPALRAPSGKKGPTHSGPVNAIEILEGVESKAGDTAARRDLVISASSEVLVWDAATGEVVCPMRLHAADVVAVEVPAGTSHQVLTRDRDRTAILWNVSTCEPLGPRFQRVIHAGFAPGHFLTAGPGEGVALWKEDDFRAEDKTPEGAIVWGTYAPGDVLVTADDRGRVFEWEKGTPVLRASSFHGAAMVASAPDHTVVLASSGKLCAWKRGEPGSCGSTLPVIEGWAMRAVALSDDGARLFVVEEKGASLRGRTFDGRTWKEGTTVSFERGDGCEGAGRVEDAWTGSQAVTVVRRGDLFRVISVEPGGCVRAWDGGGRPLLEAVGPGRAMSSGATVALAAAPYGDRLLLGGAGGAVSIWGIAGGGASGAELRYLSQDWAPHSGSVRAISFHPGGRFAVTAGDDGHVLLWDVGEARALVRLGSHRAPIHWAAFDAKGDRVVTGGAEGWIRSWSTRTVRDSTAVVGELEKWLPARSGASSPP